ncbi:MAG TPA: helix-turn-helix transcriptional regulator [Aggregatilinea sp.]|uniref:helix-turn-helix domain-containing protein n=1 Tax=Aggregatilinea sp. TaxID=2806333 RepID=UPI002CEBDBDE|nr:helix-turn-helix transcriptional regulator [Aggregatilinea sp.]HML22177.1 helix-turn-helix transcriptional regulator [Aggregatilinea sp.]
MSEEQENAIDLLAPFIRKEVGLLIRQAREEAGLSQTELSERMHRRQAYISELETGKTEPNLTVLYHLAIVLEKPMTYFIPMPYRDPSNQLRSLDELTPEESELINKMRQIEPDYDAGLARFIVNTIIDYHIKVDNEMFGEDSDK